MASTKTSYENEVGTDGITEKLVHVGRTSKVVKGGRIFGFNALIVAGDGKGRIGIGRGKAREVPVAIRKANEDARRNMQSVTLVNDTLLHPVMCRHGATRIWMKPASEGTGVIAGSALRAVCEVLGIRNILTKVIGSTSPVNVVRAAVSGLTSMVSPEMVAQKRGISLKTLAQNFGDTKIKKNAEEKAEKEDN